MKEKEINKSKNNDNLKESENISNQNPPTKDNSNINNENKIINIKMKNIIQIEDNLDNKISQTNNNDLKSNQGIPINLNNNNNENLNNMDSMNKIYKKSFPKLNGYYNHSNNNLDYGINRNISPINELYFLNQINYNRKINQLNYINNNDIIPNQNFPNIITNNNNYYYSILDDFPIHMPIYIDNEQSPINMSRNNRLYNINTFPNYNNFDNNIIRNNYFNQKDLLNYNPNLNLTNSIPIREINFNNPNMNDFYNNNRLILRNKFFNENNSDYDYINNKNRVINYKYLSKNINNIRKPIYIPISSKKRAYSHESPFNIIHKYYDENFILEEENEEDTNAENNKHHQKQEKEKNIKNINLSNAQIRCNTNNYKINNLIANNDMNIKIKFDNIQDNIIKERYICDSNINNNLTDNNNMNSNNLRFYGKNRIIKDLKISSNVNLTNNYENNSDNMILVQNYNKINRHINPNLIYAKKAINKKCIISKSPENKEKNEIINININNKDKDKINDKEKGKKDDKNSKHNKTEKNKNKKTNEVINKTQLYNNSFSNNNKAINLRKRKIQKESNKKNDLTGFDKKNKKKNLVNKQRIIYNDKYMSVNSSPINRSVNITKPNKTSKNNKNEEVSNFKEKVLKAKKNLFNKKMNIKHNINKDLKNLKINSNINKAKENIQTEKNLFNKKNKIFSNQIRIINIDSNNNQNKLLIRNAKSEKNISMDRSLDNIYSKMNNHISYYNRIFNSSNKYNINNKFNNKTNKKTNLTNKKQNLSWAAQKLNSSGDKKDKKSNKCNKFNRIIKYTATRIMKDGVIKNGKRIIIKKPLNNIINSSDNILKNKNINKIKLNLVKKKINFNKISNLDEESYTKQYIKKAKSKEKKPLNNSKAMSEKPSLKSSITRESLIINLKNNYNFPSLKSTIKNTEINNSSFNRINKIKESLTFKTLNNIKNNNHNKKKINKNNKSPLTRNNKNIIKKMYNTEIKIKIKKRNFRALLKEEINDKINEFGPIKKNKTDFINNTNFL